MIADRDFTMMQDFIGGRLSEVESRAFEDRLVRDPTLARELERSLRLREGLQQLRARAYIRKGRSRTWSFRSWGPAALAAAAIAAVALFLGLPRVGGPSPVLMASPDARTTSAGATRVAARFTFVSMRGATVPDLDLPVAGLIEIRVAPGTRESVGGYRVTLARAAEGGPAGTVASLTKVALGNDGYVHCYADASRLVVGSYLLRLQPDSDTPGLAQVFPFNLTGGAKGSSR